MASSSYAYLDSNDRKDDKLDSQRNYQGDYPDLENALYLWHIQMEKKKAPKWSNGWLDRLKKRHNIKEYKLRGEGGSVDIHNEDTVKQMDNLRAECSSYALKDIFNTDKTGLFWNLQPDRYLATQQIGGGKKSKERITLVLTANADGLEN
ncbi:hypothetical protein V498_04276 [Pseudogymnoascus sp. VKM F-4517 (FW-2822)]|nr:hypothetical protein V498_04276 [Pseudogymnoascus sp. VKM F-4517 (FW-2822)]